MPNRLILLIIKIYYIPVLVLVNKINNWLSTLIKQNGFYNFIEHLFVDIEASRNNRYTEKHTHTNAQTHSTQRK